MNLRYASPCLWNQPNLSLGQPYSGTIAYAWTISSELLGFCLYFSLYFRFCAVR